MSIRPAQTTNTAHDELQVKAPIPLRPRLKRSCNEPDNNSPSLVYRARHLELRILSREPFWHVRDPVTMPARATIRESPLSGRERFLLVREPNPLFRRSINGRVPSP